MYAACTPSVIIIIIIAYFLKRFRSSTLVDAALYGLRPASVALISAAGVDIVLIAVLRVKGQKKSLTLTFDKKRPVNYCIIQEDIAKGERIRQYKVEAKINGKWQTVCLGESVGHKRIEQFKPVETCSLRLTVTRCISSPEIINFSAYNVTDK